MSPIKIFPSERCGVVWCGVAWCGVVWCGVTLKTEKEGKQVQQFVRGEGGFSSLCHPCTLYLIFQSGDEQPRDGRIRTFPDQLS